MTYTHRTEPAGDQRRSRRLRRLVAHAYHEVPFYRERFDAAGVRPGDVRGLDDLHLLPIVEKTDLLQRPLSEITARGIDPAALVSTMTSGYSGEPLVVRRTRAEQALWARSWLDDLLAAGLRRGDRVVSVFVHREERPDGIALLPALGLIEERMIDCCLDPEEILADLRREPPTFLRGLPSVVERVARLMSAGDREILRPRVVWLSGEVVTPATRSRIETAFGAPVHDAYGAHEVGLVASDCRSSGLKHLGRHDMIVEIVEPSAPTPPPNVGEIVATPLAFSAAPLLRYRLTDAVTTGPRDCPCGHPGPTLTRIEGRTIDYFELTGGRAVHPYRILGPLLTAAPWIRQYQLVQMTPDRIVLRHVPGPGADSASAEGLETLVADVLGPGVRLEFEAVSRLEPRSGHKSRPIVSLVTRRPVRA